MKATAFGGENAESYYDEGLTASMRGELQEAIRFFEKAIRMDSSMATAYHQLGKCYARLGDKKKALTLLAQVVSKRPKLYAARIDLGNALIDAGQLKEAREQFDFILSQQPATTKALMGLANADFEQGNWAGAMAYAQTALSAGTSSFAVLFMLGRAAKLAGSADVSVRHLQKADKAMEKYVETNPDQPEGHYLRGEVAFVNENFAAALQHYKEAEDSAAERRSYAAYGETFTLADILAKQGLCLQRLGKEDRAREMGERIQRIDPQHRMGKALRDIVPQ